MNIENSSLPVLNSWSWIDYWVLRIGEQIWHWYWQIVYELLWENTWTVLKILREVAHEDLFQTHFQDLSNTDFYYEILKILQKLWIILPDQWDVINIWTESKEEIAFIQTEIDNIIMRPWNFITLPSKLDKEPYSMPPSIKMFSTNKNWVDVFIDWDEALKWASKDIARDITTRWDLERLREYWVKYEWFMHR